MASVYVVQHVHSRDDNHEGDIKFIGVYSSQVLANEAATRLKLQPGFADENGEFIVDRYELDRDRWSEGFVEAKAPDAGDSCVIGDWRGSIYLTSGKRWDLFLFLDTNNRFERTVRTESDHERRDGAFGSFPQKGSWNFAPTLRMSSTGHRPDGVYWLSRLVNLRM